MTRDLADLFRSGNVGLKSAFGLYDISERLVLVTIIYLFIVLALIIGIMPYKMRDFVNWMYSRSIGPRVFGGTLVVMSLALIVSALLY